MNPRRVHELMLKHFPKFDSVDCEWINVADRAGPRTALIEGMLAEYIPASEVVVEVHRKLGAFLPKSEALAFICEHLGKGDIRVADRQFESFVVVMKNGVATGRKPVAQASHVQPGTNGE